jgi:hypothetical protein
VSLAAAGLFAASLFSPGDAIGGARGSKSLVGPRLSIVGGVDDRSPRVLAAAAVVPLRQYVIAVMVESEAGDQGWTAKVAKGYVALNDAIDLGWKLSDGRPDVVRVLTFDLTSAQSGLLGEQRGRRYATSRTPTGDSVAAAAEVLRLWGLQRDPTRSASGQRAVKFSDPKAFGVQAGTGSFAVSHAARLAEGRASWSVEGVPGTVFYGPSRGRDLVS